MKLECTHWRWLREPVGRPFVTTWTKLAERFKSPLEVATKDAIPGWAPVSFQDHRRSKANVKKICAIGFDFDDLDVSFEELCGAFHNATMLHTTYSHTADAPRARALILLKRAISSLEHERIWPFLAERMTEAGQVPDPAAKDPSRLWFVPAVTPGSARYYRMHVVEAPPLDVDSLLASIPEIEPKPATLPRPIERRPLIADERTDASVLERARAYLARCDVSIAGQGGHRTAFLVAQKLVRGFELDVGTAFELMSTLWNPSCQPPWSQAELFRKVQQAAKEGRMPLGALRDAQRRAG